MSLRPGACRCEVWSQARHWIRPSESSSHQSWSFWTVSSDGKRTCVSFDETNHIIMRLFPIMAMFFLGPFGLNRWFESLLDSEIHLGPLIRQGCGRAAMERAPRGRQMHWDALPYRPTPLWSSKIGWSKMVHKWSVFKIVFTP